MTKNPILDYALFISTEHLGGITELSRPGVSKTLVLV